MIVIQPSLDISLEEFLTIRSLWTTFNEKENQIEFSLFTSWMKERLHYLRKTNYKCLVRGWYCYLEFFSEALDRRFFSIPPSWSMVPGSWEEATDVQSATGTKTDGDVSAPCPVKRGLLLTCNPTRVWIELTFVRHSVYHLEKILAMPASDRMVSIDILYPGSLGNTRKESCLTKLTNIIINYQWKVVKCMTII